MKSEGSNFQQAMWLGIGQLCTFIIAFLTAPILARYFGKVEYGTYKQILYVYTTLQTLFVIGLPNVFSYFLPKLSDGQQKQLVNKMTLLLLIIGGIFSLILFFSSGLIAELLNNQELSNGLKLFSIFPLFTLPTMGVEGIYTTIRKTRIIATYQIVSKFLMSACIVLPVIIWHTGYRAAVIGWGIASFLTFIMAMFMKIMPYKSVKREEIPQLYRSVFNYTLPLTGATVAGFFINFADQFFISHFYGTEVFAIASNGYFSIPIIGMIAGSVKSVLLPLFSKADTNNTISDAMASYTNAVKKTTTITLPILLFCFCFAKDIMHILFGIQYVDSSSFFRMHIIRDFFEIIPYYSVLMALGFSKFYMNLHIFGTIFIWAADFLIVYFTKNPPCITLVSSLFQVSCRIFSILYIKKRKGINLISTQLLKYIIKITIHCSAILLTLFFIRYIIVNNIGVFVSTILLCVLYVMIMIVSGKYLNIDYLESVKILLKNKKHA